MALLYLFNPSLGAGLELARVLNTDFSEFLSPKDDFEGQQLFPFLGFRPSQRLDFVPRSNSMDRSKSAYLLRLGSLRG